MEKQLDIKDTYKELKNLKKELKSTKQDLYNAEKRIDILSEQVLYLKKTNERKEFTLDKIKKISNQVKEEAKEVENEWTYQVMKEIDYVLEGKNEFRK